MKSDGSLVLLVMAKQLKLQLIISLLMKTRECHYNSFKVHSGLLKQVTELRETTDFVQDQDQDLFFC